MVDVQIKAVRQHALDLSGIDAGRVATLELNNAAEYVVAVLARLFDLKLRVELGFHGQILDRVHFS